MEKRGFSLIEILVVLVLSTSIALALLKQQWQISRLRVQIQRNLQADLQQTNQHEQGFTLLECMLGLGLAVLILSLLLQQYLQIKQQTDLAMHSIRQATRLQTVVTFLRQSGHQAGFTPCLPLDYLRSLDHHGGRRLQSMRLEQQSPDQMTFYRMASHYSSILPTGEPDQFVFTDPFAVRLNQPLIIADCQHAEVVYHYEKHGQILQFLYHLRFKYHAPIYLGAWLSETFTVKLNSKGQKSLFYQQGDHNEELLTEVQSLAAQLEGRADKRWLQLTLQMNEDVFPISIRLWHVLA